MRSFVETASRPLTNARASAKFEDAVILYNPTSGRHRRLRLRELEEASKILGEAGIRADLVPTAARGLAAALARRAVEQKRGLVIACGGDGTINEIANGLAGSQVPLAVLPAGTANVLAKELQIPRSIPAAARLIPGGTLRRIALGQARTQLAPTGRPQPANARYFLCLAGAGPDAALVHGVSEKLKLSTGQFAYWAEGIRQFFTYRMPLFRVSSPARTLEASLIVIGRTRHYGGPFQITRGASLFDDMFEIAAYSRRSRFGLLRCLPAIWLDRLRRVPGIAIWKTSELACESPPGTNICVQVDGEPAGHLPAQFRIVPAALTLVLPAVEEPKRGPGNPRAGLRNSGPRRA